MTNLIDLLQGQMSDTLVDTLSTQTGINDSAKTASASNAVFSFLTNALAKNVTSTSGLNGLAGALDKDHDGSILDDLGSFFTGNDSQMNSRMTNGVGILGHLLGVRQNTAIDMVARMAGLDNNKTAMLMVKLAPMVLGMVGRMKKKENLDQNGLGDFLKKSAQNDVQQHGQQGFFERLLDQDGDGNMMDDVAMGGLKALGRYFLR